MAKRQVFAIGLPGPYEVGDVAAMGFKAWNLWKMAAAGLPVPQAFVLGTGWCESFIEDEAACRHDLRPVLKEHLRKLEAACGQSFGSDRRPLLVSVRSGAPTSMPGMMDTFLNVGLSEASVPGLLRATGNPRLVWDSYRRLVQQFAEVVAGLPSEPFRAAAEQALERGGHERLGDLDFNGLRQLTRDFLALYLDLAGTPFPQDTMLQLENATAAVFRSWRAPRATEYRRLNALPDSPGTSATVQRMVFGNAGGTSGAGVAFTRDPANGENRLYVDFVFNGQGEDVVSGRHRGNDAERLPRALPEVQQLLLEVRSLLERQFGDMQEFEFTVQDGRLFLLQTRAGKRTPWAALHIAVDQVHEGSLARDEVCLVGCPTLHMDRAARSISFDNRHLREGEALTLDADSGRIFAGLLEVVHERPDAWLKDVEGWRNA
jgi:pyruvate, orthophosphate dikinase